MKKLPTLLLTILCSFSFAQAQLFQRLDAQAGLDFIQNTHGVSVADFDLDGDLDIFFVGIASFVPALDSTWNRLMKNNGDGTFTDVTLEAGFTDQYINYGIPAARGEKMGASWADYDNDGDPDIFLTNSRKDQLYQNQGNGTFLNVTETANVDGCLECYSSSGLWVDYNRDGFLDLYVSILNGPNIMYENLGDGTFKDITEESGLGGTAITWSTAAWDVNGDGFPDLYLMNDSRPNEYFESRSGGLHQESGIVYRIDDPGSGMGFTLGDYNNDGLFDLYLTNIYSQLANPLFTNTGTGSFANQAEAMGVENSGWGWGTKFFDYDHDGDEDLFAVNGPIDKLFGVPQEAEPNYFFKNMLVEGEEKFENLSLELGTADTTGAKGLEVFDFDQDGDLDILVSNMRTSPFLYENHSIDGTTPSNKNWIKINLEGTSSNRNGFGATLNARIAEKAYHRIHHGAGLFSQSVYPVHFGLGSAQRVDELIINWPSGGKDTLRNLEVNQTYEVKETIRDQNINPNVPIGSTETSSSSFPNPFSDQTVIQFKVPRSGTLTLSIFSSTGQKLFTGKYEMIKAGTYNINWGGADRFGAKVSSGIYYYVADFDSQIEDLNFHGKLLKQ